MTDTITSLIEKLEQAEVGSYGLDDLVLEATGHKYHIDFGSAWYARPGHNERIYGNGPARVTTSLDAALALAERVLTMGAWDVGYTYNSDRPHYARLVIVRDDEGQPEIYGRAATPALALCIAVLRAQSEAR